MSPEGIHPVPAPQPESGPVPPAGPMPPAEPFPAGMPTPTPVRAPVPLPLAGPTRPGSRLSGRALVIAGGIVVVVGLVVAVAVVGLTVTAFFRSAGRIADLAPPTTPSGYAASEVDPPTLSMLKARVEEDYPDFDFVDALAAPASGQAKVYWVTLKNRARSDLTFIATYEGWGTTAGGAPPEVISKDPVFQVAGEFHVHAEGLYDVLEREHDGAPVEIRSVIAPVIDATTTIAFDLLIAPEDIDSEEAGDWETYVLDLSTRSWRRGSDPEASDEDTEPAIDEEAVRTAAAKAYPAYRVGESWPGVSAFGDPMVFIVLEHRKYPGFMWVYNSEEAADPDSWPLTAIMFAPRNAARGDAFARTWRSRHPGTVVWEVISDSGEMTDDTMRVRYFDTVAGIRSPGAQPREATFRYDPARKAWTETP